MISVNGFVVDLHDPQPDTLSILDIAHNLARINRFNGATRTPYSVADHSVWVSKVVPEEFALAGLMHDASEAYLGDIIAPLKSRLPEYIRLERNFDSVIGETFNVRSGGNTPRKVHEADKAAAVLEMFALGHPGYREQEKHLQTMPDELRFEPVIPRSPERATELFIDRFNQLTGSNL